MGKEHSVPGQFVLASGMMQVLSQLLSINSCSSDSLIQHFLLWLVLVPLVLGTSTFFSPSFSTRVHSFSRWKKKCLIFIPRKEKANTFAAFSYIVHDFSKRLEKRLTQNKALSMENILKCHPYFQLLIVTGFAAYLNKPGIKHRLEFLQKFYLWIVDMSSGAGKKQVIR